MTDMRTTYLGLDIDNPILVGSSGFTGNIKDIVAIAEQGAGGVVLKSLFEEEIQGEAGSLAGSSKGASYGSEAEAYLDYYVKQNNVQNYLALIRESKKNTSLPVIASINCVSSTEWTSFASRIQDAGADALELNIFILPSNPKTSSAELEKRYFEIIGAVKKNISIPVCVKISPYFTAMAKTYVDISETVDGMVLFNRFFNPDIDINKKEIISGGVYSSPHDIGHSLRWVALLSDEVKCDLAVSSGIHDGEGAVKALLVGARVAYIATTVYINGIGVIPRIISFIQSWMEDNNYGSLQDFRGLLNSKNIRNPEVYERAQFMKYFSSHDQ